MALSGQEELERRMLALLRQDIENAEESEISADGWEIRNSNDRLRHPRAAA